MFILRKKKGIELSCYLKNLVEKSGEVFWIKNTDYSVQIYISPAYEKIWGRPREELYNNSIDWIETIFIEDQEYLKKSLNARNQRAYPGQKFFESYRIIRPDQEIRWIEDESFAIFNDKNQHIGFAGIAKDITEKKSREIFLEKAKKQAEAASIAKAEFIANMSHDVKTPLSGIIGLSELLKSRLREGEDLDLAKGIYTSGQRLMDFFENCLELSKSEINESAFLEEPFNLRTLLNEIYELFQPSIKEKDLFFKINYDPKTPDEFLGGRAGLYRIMTNLIGNAIKFTPSGDITVHIKLGEKSTEKQAIVKIVVEDTGIGIPKDKQEIIFERFSRVTPSYLGTYQGTGLGLYIVQKFVKTMHGEVYVQSEKGKGSRFIVTLPLKIPLLTLNEYFEDMKMFSYDQEKNNLLQKNTVSKIKLDDKNLPAKILHKILLVEDDLIAQTIAKIMLSPLSQQIDVANCGKKTLELFEPGKYDLVLMDIGLPDIEGDLLTQQLRVMEEGSIHSAPIIGLTAHATDQIKKNCISLGMNDVFNKPLSEEKAKEIIERYAK